MSLPDGIVCTPAEYEQSQRDPSTKHCLTRGGSIGLTAIAGVGLLSLLALFCALLLIVCKAIGRIHNGSQVFRTPMELLMLSLLLADVLQAIGSVLNVKWIYDGKVVTGTFCNVQGIISNIGETGVALSTLAISAFTFIGIRFGRRVQSMKIALGVISVIWGFILIVVTIGNTINHGYEAPTPYWCWISSDYMPWRIFAEYIWLWSALIFSLLTYIPICIYLWKRARLNVWTVTRRDSLLMLAYPTVYCLTVLPVTIARWLAFGQQASYGASFVPAVATFAAAAIFGLSGFLNVVLLLTTRSRLFGISKAKSTSEGSTSELPLPLVAVPSR